MAALTGAAGELEVKKVGKVVVISGDVDGDGVDFTIALAGKPDIDAGAFVL